MRAMFKGGDNAANMDHMRLMAQLLQKLSQRESAGDKENEKHSQLHRQISDFVYIIHPWYHTYTHMLLPALLEAIAVGTWYRVSSFVLLLAHFIFNFHRRMLPQVVTKQGNVELNYRHFGLEISKNWS